MNVIQDAQFRTPNVHSGYSGWSGSWRPSWGILKILKIPGFDNPAQPCGDVVRCIYRLMVYALLIADNDGATHPTEPYLSALFGPHLDLYRCRVMRFKRRHRGFFRCDFHCAFNAIVYHMCHVHTAVILINAFRTMGVGTFWGRTQVVHRGMGAPVPWVLSRNLGPPHRSRQTY